MKSLSYCCGRKKSKRAPNKNSNNLYYVKTKMDY